MGSSYPGVTPHVPGSIAELSTSSPGVSAAAAVGEATSGDILPHTVPSTPATSGVGAAAARGTWVGAGAGWCLTRARFAFRADRPRPCAPRLGKSPKLGKSLSAAVNVGCGATGAAASCSNCCWSCLASSASSAYRCVLPVSPRQATRRPHAHEQ